MKNTSTTEAERKKVQFRTETPGANELSIIKRISLVRLTKHHHTNIICTKNTIES